MTELFVIIGWLVCGVSSYFMFREVDRISCKKHICKYTKLDRANNLFLSIWGPVSLLLSGAKLWVIKNGDKKAKW